MMEKITFILWLLTEAIIPKILLLFLFYIELKKYHKFESFEFISINYLNVSFIIFFIIHENYDL